MFVYERKQKVLLGQLNHQLHSNGKLNDSSLKRKIAMHHELRGKSMSQSHKIMISLKITSK